ncbi:MAG: 23S rRNA (guanosine(2251)-2'-O)-methyltransferase RlmB [Actinobacteria bacterium]|nr:23S rRNA (guanosine(2251)-2'-O)-methyltransferase RlmB [Actinomycetota bacterium]
MAKQPKRRALRGKGPTPRAENRPNHKKYRGGEDKKRRDVRSGDSRRDEGKRSEFGRKRVERKRIDSKRGDRQRDFRREPREHHDTIAGRNAVVEALRAGLPAKELVVAIGVDIDERLEESVKLAQKMGLGIREVERRQIENMTGIANHQGIALVAKPFQYSSQKEIFSRANGLLIPERRNAPLTAAAWKSSAGAAARLPIAQVTNLVRSMQDAKEFGCFIVGLDGDADTAVEEIEIADQPIYLVVGSEGRGLSRLVRENCDLLIKIPMSNTVESLNASVAMSIALYAVDRKRHAI